VESAGLLTGVSLLSVAIVVVITGSLRLQEPGAMNTPTRPEKNGPGHGAHERSATELLPLERQLTECIVVPQGVSLGSARPKMTRRQVDKT
jgi:hypothetical protein